MKNGVLPAFLRSASEGDAGYLKIIFEKGT